MNFLNLLFLSILGLSALNVDARILSRDDNNFRVEIASADLITEQNASVEIYALDVTAPLNLPITLAELRGITYVTYSTPTVMHTRHPSWFSVYSFSETIFTNNTYIALELWTVVNSPKYENVYLGGATFTVEHLKRLPLNSAVVMINDTTGASPGNVTISYN